MAASSAPQTEAKGGFSFKLVIVLVLLAAALVFVFSNLQSVTLSFVGMQINAPMWIWFLVLLVIGVVIGSIFPWFRAKKKKNS